MSRTLLAILRVIAAAVAVAVAVPAGAQVTGALPPPQTPLGPSAPTPTLKRFVTVTSDIVRLGDLIDNAGALAAIPVFRSPDVGTTGSVPGRKVVEAARANNLFAVDPGDVVEIEVTRAGRIIGRKEIEARIAKLFAGTNGLGDASDLLVNFDREAASFTADLAPGAELKAMRAALDPRSGRFDVVFEVPIGATRRTLMRYTGSVIEVTDAVVALRTIGRGEIIRSADLAVERRPKTEISGDVIATASEAIGRAARQGLRSGQPVHRADLVKPDFVKRDETVTLIFQVPGILLTTRGKALEAGGEGDVISVLNAQSNRTIQGVVTGPGRVEIAAANTRANPNQPTDEPSAGTQ
jgi:flagellar basal body P-ring formation protein FlgA